MTREEAINEINKVFTSAYANYIVTALTEGATVSDIQRRWGQAYETGAKDGLEQELDTWSLDDAREYFMRDVYNELNFLPTNDEANRIIDSFDRVISSIEQELSWIPVTERLPDEGYSVLVMRITDENYKYMRVATYQGDCWMDDTDKFNKPNPHKVIAWMSLPVPYKEDKE